MGFRLEVRSYEVAFGKHHFGYVVTDTLTGATTFVEVTGGIRRRWWDILGDWAVHVGPMIGKPQIAF